MLKREQELAIRFEEMVREMLDRGEIRETPAAAAKAMEAIKARLNQTLNNADSAKVQQALKEALSGVSIAQEKVVEKLRNLDF